MRFYIRAILVGMLWGVLYSLFFINSRFQVTLSSIVFVFGFDRPDFLIDYVFLITMHMFPIFMFQVLFGTYIYRHFCTASIYYFSRYEKRGKWFLQEAYSLYLYGFVYLLVEVIVTVVIACIFEPVIWDKEGIILFFYHIVIQSLWLWFTTLLVNIIAIKSNSSTGFTIVSGIQFLFIFLILLWKDIFPLEEVAKEVIIRNGWLLQLNPIAHLVLSWHSSFLPEVNQLICLYPISFDLNHSVILFILYNFILIGIGYRMIEKEEIIITNRETGGV